MTWHWEWKHSKPNFSESSFLLSQSFLPTDAELHLSRDRNSDVLTTYKLNVTFCSQLTPIYLSLMWGNNNGLDRRTGTCQHAEHCTLFWHNRNKCFPTQALDTKQVLTTVLLDDNREVYVVLHLCYQKITTPLVFFCTTTTLQETWWHDWSASIKDKDCVLLEQRYPTSLPGPYAMCETGHRVEPGLIHRSTAAN